MKETAVVPPTAVQDLLLRATFLPGDAGIEAWRSWRSRVDLDGHLDLGSFRLLPGLARRLRQWCIDDPLLDRFAGISRKHWVANRLFFRDLELLSQMLHARAVQVMVPAEIALALLHYPDHPLDPSLNHALVVPDHQAATAFQVLEAAGWTPTPRIADPLLDRYVSARSWHPFRGPGDSHLRLCWHVLPQRATRVVDREYWSRATSVSLGNEIVATLSPTDHLVQLSTQRVAMRMTPLFIRAVDVMLLLAASPYRIDWNHLIAQAAEPGLILPIRETLGYLQDRLDEPVPAHVFAQLLTHAVSRVERWEYRLTTSHVSRPGDLLHLWLDYRRRSSRSALATAMRFPRFLQHYLRLSHLWQIPLRALLRTTDRAQDRTGEALAQPRRIRDAPTTGR